MLKKVLITPALPDAGTRLSPGCVLAAAAREMKRLGASGVDGENKATFLNIVR
jgi:hypothetical protein